MQDENNLAHFCGGGKEWLEKRDLTNKAQLIMHTNPFDQHGQNLNEIAEQLDMTNRELVFSTKKIRIPSNGCVLPLC